MDTKKEAKKYLNKYFKAQYLKETDDEYKSLVRLLNKALHIHDVVGRSEQLHCPHCGQLEPCAGNSPETCYHPKVC